MVILPGYYVYQSRNADRNSILQSLHSSCMSEIILYFMVDSKYEVMKYGNVNCFLFGKL